MKNHKPIIILAGLHNLRNFRYCSDDVKCMLSRSFCTNMYCSPLWFNSTSSNIKKLKSSYNGALRRLLLIKKTYSASTMFVTHGIPSFFELLRKCIYNFSQRISLSSNSIIVACLYLFTHPPDNGGDQYYINNFFLTLIYLFIYCMYVFLIIMFLLCIWTYV